MSGAAKKTVEQWAQEKNTPDWLFGAAKSAFTWASGKELTEEEYLKAVTTAGGTASADGNPFDVAPEEPPKPPESDGGEPPTP